MELSKLKLFSLGLVASNKPLSSKTIEVTPIELLPFMDGEINAEINISSVSGVDRDGKAYTVSVANGTSIKATWLPMGNTNRRTAPDVRRGERVLIYRYGDSDRYFWVDMGLDSRLKKLETVTHSWSNTRDENKDSTDPKNCYFFEVSTHKKLITLSTNKSDGEPYAYTVQINTGKGNLTITDDIGNFIEMDSVKRSLLLHNSDNSIVHLDKSKVLIKGDSEVKIVSGATVVTHTPDGTVHETPKFEGKKS